MKVSTKLLSAAFGIFMLGVGTIWAQDTTQRNEMLLNGVSFINTPYVAGTLDVNAEEQLVLNTDEMDCTTFVENVLAMSLAEDANMVVNEMDFADWLTKIRYRDGKINGYTSRLHYATEWVSNGVKLGFLQDITEFQSPYTLKVKLGYMTNHPTAYPLMAASTANLSGMRQIESNISGTEIHFVPKEYLPDEGFVWIQNGDIILITSNVDGLDVAHMGIAVNIDGILTLLHASSADKKVLVSRVSLREMLNRNRTWTGIRVVRMKK